MPKDTFLNLPSEKQEKIMRASINEFIRHGFEKGNIGEIAKEAGVAKGSMYQYFENKRELFLDSIKWALDLLMKKYAKYLTLQDKTMDIFDFLYLNAKNSWYQMREEREVVIFIQDVFLGKYKSFTDESMTYITKLTDDYLLKLIQEGKNNGSIRTDIDDQLLALYVTGVSLKIKEHWMNQARSLGEDLVDEDFEDYESDIKAMIDLLKNGMGGKINVC